MSENHKYYYMKLKETFFSVPKVALLEQMRDGPLSGAGVSRAYKTVICTITPLPTITARIL